MRTDGRRPRRRNATRPGAVAPGLVRSSGDRIRTCDLWVMSPASYRAAPPRVVSPPYTARPDDARGPRRGTAVAVGARWPAAERASLSVSRLALTVKPV